VKSLKLIALGLLFALGARADITGPVTVPYPVPQILMQSAIPFVISSSCTMGANGAASACVAMPRTIGASYSYWPANAICTANTAGWYWTVWSSTTAGTIYNNVYSSGQPVYQSSPTAFSCSAGSGTQAATSMIQGPTVPVPAGTMGANGSLQMLALSSFINSSGSKQIAGNFGGTQVALAAYTTIATSGWMGLTTNQGVATSQASAGGTMFSQTGLQIVTTAVNTANTVTAYISALLSANATDYFIIESYSFTLLPHS
jgi:hypothetical protein